jgi:hypothetical protein
MHRVEKMVASARVLVCALTDGKIELRALHDLHLFRFVDLTRNGAITFLGFSAGIRNYSYSHLP